MVKNLLIVLVIFVFFGCDYFKDDEENFIDAYTNILIVREKYKNDSLKAEKEIKKIYEEFGYSQESFKEEFFEIAHSDTRRFYELLDSVREKVRIDLLESSKKNGKRKADRE